MTRRPDTCAKCKKAPPAEEDSWCKLCSAVESLGALAKETWGVASYRKIAEDLVIDINRNCRALLVLARRTKSLADSHAAKSQHPWHKGHQGLTTAPKGGAKPALVRSPKKTEAKEEVTEAGEEQEGREEEGATSAPSSGPGGAKPPEPAGPPPERRRSRSRHRGRRGGAKHQEHYRGLTNPHLRFHRKHKDERPEDERRRK